MFTNYEFLNSYNNNYFWPSKPLIVKFISVDYFRPVMSVKVMSYNSD